jgi:hypothetical protein
MYSTLARKDMPKMKYPLTEEPYRVPAPGAAAEPVRTPEELAELATRHKAAGRKAKRKDYARARWMLLNRFVDDGMAGLELSDATVWFALFRNARADGVVMVARVRLETMTGLTARTVKVSLQRLIVSGWVERLRRGGPSGGMAVYRVQAPNKAEK